MKFESNQHDNAPGPQSEADESLPGYCKGCQGPVCHIDGIPRTCAEMAAEMNGETPIREIGARENGCIPDGPECDLEDVEEMIQEIERMQARERGQGPSETLPEMEYIIENEWGD